MNKIFDNGKNKRIYIYITYCLKYYRYIRFLLIF